MTYMLLDINGNAINAYDELVAAHVAMRSLVADEPALADELLLVGYDEAGLPLGRAETFADLPDATTTTRPAPWLSQGLAAATLGSIAESRYVAAASRVVLDRSLGDQAARA